MPTPHVQKQDSARTKRNTAPSETELQKQLADSEGMTPNKPQREKALENEGEGNRTADRSYRRAIKRFLNAGRAEEAAEKAARAIDGEEGEELRHAEQLGKKGPLH
jgi:hypothetical protein